MQSIFVNLKIILHLIERCRNVIINRDYFESRWKEYLKKKNLLDGTKNPKPDNLKVDERDTFYKKLSFCGFGGASGHDAPMIA